MNVEQLTNQLYSNLNELLSPKHYRNILNRANNLSGFDVINRLVIEMQNPKAFELRTEEEWELNGRKVSKKAKPVYIIMPRYSYRYRDTQSGEIITNSDLNSNEIAKALEYKIIEQVELLDNLYYVEMYDIRDTVGTSNNEYTVSKPIVSAKDILELFSKLTEANIEKCDESYYSKSTNTLFINNQSHKELVSTVSKYLTIYYMNSKVRDIIKDTFNIDMDSLSQYEIQLLEDSINYSIATLLGINIDVSFDSVAHTPNDIITTILNVTDNVIFEIAQHLQFSNKTKFKDAISSITMLRKSEVILNIMEANNILSKMKGAR